MPGRFAAAAALPADPEFGSVSFTRGDRYLSEIGGVSRLLARLPRQARVSAPDSEVALLLERLFALSRAASNRYLGAKNGFLVLDTLYNLGLVSNREDGLRILLARREFFLRLRAWSPDSPDSGRPGALRPHSHIQVLLGLCRAWPGSRGRILKDALRILRIRRLTASIFAEYACQRLSLPETCLLLEQLRSALEQRRRKARQGAAPGENVWALARRLVRTDADALELLGVFGSQHRTLRKTVLALMADQEHDPRLVHALHNSAEIFFLIQEIGEFERPGTGNFHFAYPEGFGSDNARFYHFWAAAFLAYRLRALGHPSRAVQWVSLSLARAYETYTLPLNLLAAGRMGASLTRQARNWRQDVRCHEQGAAFGLAIGEAG